MRMGQGAADPVSCDRYARSLGVRASVSVRPRWPPRIACRDFLGNRSAHRLPLASGAIAGRTRTGIWRRRSNRDPLLAGVSGLALIFRRRQYEHWLLRRSLTSLPAYTREPQASAHRKVPSSRGAWQPKHAVRAPTACGRGHDVLEPQRRIQRRNTRARRKGRTRIGVSCSRIGTFVAASSEQRRWWYPDPRPTMTVAPQPAPGRSPRREEHQRRGGTTEPGSTITVNGRIDRHHTVRVRSRFVLGGPPGYAPDHRRGRASRAG